MPPYEASPSSLHDSSSDGLSNSSSSSRYEQHDDSNNKHNNSRQQQDPARTTTPKRPRQQQHRQSPPSSPTQDMYSTTRQASDLMKGSIQAVLDYLAREGVSKASMDQLYRDFHCTNHYVRIMERAQSYAECVYEYRREHQDDSARIIVLYLLEAAWRALAAFLVLEYQQAHRHYHTLRRRREDLYAKSVANAEQGELQELGRRQRQRGGRQQQHSRQLTCNKENAVTKPEVQKALDQKLRLAELCCASQKGCLLVQAWERRVTRATARSSAKQNNKKQ